MKPFSWDPRKNELLILERGISFEIITAGIASGGLLEVLTNPDTSKYPGQKLFVVAALDYIFLVPFEEREDVIHLITIIPSRKALKKHNRKEKPL